MSAIRCFVMEDSGINRISLRRYVRGDEHCPGSHGYHDASVVIREEPDSNDINRDATAEERLDPRWPVACGCGRAFTEDDAWQISGDSLYRGLHPEHGPLVCTIREMPPGALYRARWFEGYSYGGADGACWVCITPGGPWNIDGPSRVGAKWERSGSAPLFTVRPSILMTNPDGSERYHGWLTEGVLTPC